MDVGGAVVDGVQQHLLDELDDRCVVDFLRCRFIGLARRLLVEKVQIDVVGRQVL